jgi:hypothetical protein
MISAALERAILSGKAWYAPYSIGGSGVGRIPFPSNVHCMVVLNFVWHPFNDKPTLVNGIPIEEGASRSIHTMTLWNGERKAIYNMRDNVYKEGGANKSYVLFQSPTVVPTYYMAKRDINVNVYVSFPAPLTNFDSDLIPTTSQEQAFPNGYGNEQAVRLIRDTSTPAQVVPLTVSDPAIPASGAKRNEFHDAITRDTTLIIPPGLDEPLLNFESQYPLITFGVVYLNITPDELFNSQ